MAVLKTVDINPMMGNSWFILILCISITCTMALFSTLIMIFVCACCDGGKVRRRKRIKKRSKTIANSQSMDDTTGKSDSSSKGSDLTPDTVSCACCDEEQLYQEAAKAGKIAIKYEPCIPVVETTSKIENAQSEMKRMPASTNSVPSVRDEGSGVRVQSMMVSIDDPL